MSLFPKNQETKTELSVKKQQQIERELVGKITPHKNHIVFEIHNISGKIEKAQYIEKNYFFGLKKKNNKEVLYREGYSYVAALNKKNALKKHKSKNNGSKSFSRHIVTLTNY